MCDAITDAFHGTLFPPGLDAEKRIVLDAVHAAKGGGLVGRWRAAGMTAGDAYVELAHNLVGMTLQWAFLLWRLARTGTKLVTIQDAVDFVLEDLPAKVAASRVDGALVVHDLEAQCRKVRRPPHDPHYVAFGCGARRCPGEWLTYVLLTTVRVTGPAEREAGQRLGLNSC